MNKVYLAGEIIEISELKFFYNSKKHNSQIIVRLKTFESNLIKSTIINLKAYDNIADIIYRSYNNRDVIFLEGRIINYADVEIVRVYEQEILNI